MSLQKRILQRYRQFYPNDTLREVSARTGIQITRVFRLFNGKTMKVLELEALENAVNEKLKSSHHHARLTDVLEKASAILTNDELAKIISLIERKNMAKTYGRMYIRPVLETASIA
jgi:hypothetical protein